MSAELRITAIVAAYNEADIIGQTVGDLVRQNIHVHVLDNLSTDGTAAVLDRYADTGLVHVERFPSADAGAGARYEHARIIRRKQELALELDADWFIAHDADEIRESPWMNVSLREGIELVDRAGWNAIDFTVLNFCPTDDGFGPDVDVRQAFRHYEPAGPWDRAQVKCWKKAPDLELVASAGHDARFGSRRVFPVRFILRHYPVRSQTQGTRKVFEERKPRFLDEERSRGWHVQYDDISPGHLFLRDPKTLVEFAPERFRAESLIRDMDELQATVDRLREQAVALQDQINQHAAGAVVQGRQIEAQRKQLEIQSQAIDEQTRYLDHLSALLADRGTVVTGPQDSHDLRADIEHQITRLQSEIRALRASLSWKITAPLRAVWGFLQGR